MINWARSPYSAVSAWRDVRWRAWNGLASAWRRRRVIIEVAGSPAGGAAAAAARRADRPPRGAAQRFRADRPQRHPAERGDAAVGRSTPKSGPPGSRRRRSARYASKSPVSAAVICARSGTCRPAARLLLSPNPRGAHRNDARNTVSPLSRSLGFRQRKVCTRTAVPVPGRGEDQGFTARKCGLAGALRLSDRTWRRPSATGRTGTRFPAIGQTP